VHILAATLLVSAFLLFLCQPMVGKMLLPYLGGAAGVWTTCVLFFQAMLLLGYIYAHLLARVADIRKQIATHAVLLLLPLAFLPIRFDDASSETFSLSPLTRLLLVLITSTSIPFFVISTTAPLLQNWFSRTAHAASSDPYFLYSASNAGSLLALIAYPFVLEPRIGVDAQSQVWFWGYLGLMAMFVATIMSLHSRGWVAMEQQRQESARWRQKAFWIAASFIPSALMLAVTNHIVANVGSVPFLWLMPLALYLLTFILAFARLRRVSSERIARLIPIPLLAFFPLLAPGIVASPGLNWILIGVHVLLLWCGALLCHTRLAESRPETQHLTEFYFWVALGGVLGGVFTAIVAPALFNNVFEYPLLIALVPFFRSGKWKRSDVLVAVGLAVAVFATWLVFRLTRLDSNTEAFALVHTALLFIGYKFSRLPKRFAAVFAVFVCGYALILPGYIDRANGIYIARNFFGVKKVLDDPEAKLRKLLHGDTIHGMESTDPARAGQPLSYYFKGGSVSDVVEMMRGRGKSQRLAVLGLGAGTMGAYADSAHHVTFYEIDPSVEPIARRFFTFLTRCGSNCDVIIGDGRLQLAQEPDQAFDLILLDAFSSDSVPTHLLSQEALQMYLAKLKADGVLLFNVSNRYLNVETLVSALVADAGLVALARFDEAGAMKELGKSTANHVAVARRLEDLGPLAGLEGWRRLSRPPGFRAWTDDYSNLLSLIRWH